METKNTKTIQQQLLRTLLFAMSTILLSMGTTCGDDDFLKRSDSSIASSIQGSWQLISIIQYDKSGRVLKAELPEQKECPLPTYSFLKTNVLDIDDYKKEEGKCIKYTEGKATWKVQNLKLIITNQSDKKQTEYNVTEEKTTLDLEYFIETNDNTFDPKTARVLYQLKKIKDYKTTQ